MWKIVAAGGSLGHVAAGTWALASAAAQAEPLVWLAAMLHALGLGLLGLVATVLARMFSMPPEVFSIRQDG